MGGLLLARTVEKWGLHKQIALAIILFVGTTPDRLILGFMLATAFLSMWISNTASTAMVLPIAFAVGEMFRPQDQEGSYNFGVALMLGVAYAASIGGVSTLIGTPPNAVLAGAARELLGVEIGFVQWMGVGVPVALVMLPLTWIILTRVLYPPGELTGDGSEIIEGERRALGAPSKGERLTGVVFGLTALAWVLRSEKTIGGLTIPGLQTLSPNLQDSTIAMIAAAVLFVLPVDWKKGEFALDWRTAGGIPWGVLVLFGGGLSLARAMDQSGLAAWIGGGVGSLQGGAGPSHRLRCGHARCRPDRTHVKCGDDEYGDARDGRGGGRVLDGAPPLDDDRRAGGVHGVHAPRRDTAKRDRLRVGLHHDSTDEPRRAPPQPLRDRLDRRAREHPHPPLPGRLNGASAGHSQVNENSAD